MDALRVSEDSRTPLERCRLWHLRKVADHFGLQYPRDTGAISLRALIEGSGVNVQEGLAQIAWDEIPTYGEDGKRKGSEYYPRTDPHASMQVSEDQRIAALERANEKAAGMELKAENAERERDETNRKLDAAMDTMNKILERIEFLESRSVPVETMTMEQLQTLCKRRGIKTSMLKSKQALIEALDGHTAERGQ